MGAGRVPGPLGAAEVSAGVVVGAPGPVCNRGQHGGRHHRRSRNRTAVNATVGAERSTSRGRIEDFKRAVLERQIAHLVAKGRSFFPDVLARELEIVEGKHRMRSAGAAKCRELLAAARADLAAQQAEGNAHAIRTTTIVIHSAYRSFSEDSRAWEGSFAKHYAKMNKTDGFVDQELGPKAVRYMAQKMIAFKAPPGYSNHSNGSAVDFGTTHDGVYYKADSSTREAWRKTWLHPWLVKNAATFGFRPLSTEEWHWDFM